MDKFSKWLNKHYFWINPILILLTTISSAFLTYIFPNNFEKNHPIKYTIFSPILNYIVYIFIFFATALAIVTFFDIKNKKTIDKLEKELEQFKSISETISENIKELFNGFLYKFAINKAEFSSNERVTLYIHNGDKLFIPFGRYSPNTKYAKSGRTNYPDNIGCIAKGWEKGWHFDNSFPDDKEEYLSKNKDDYGMDKQIVKKLKMKSKLFAVLRLDNTDGKAKAVIVVESMQSDKYKESQIKKILIEQKEYLATIINSLEQYIPKPSNASRVEDL